MQIKKLTPITKGNEWNYKREDLFAPFEKNGINGSKLRQVYYLCEKAVGLGYKGIVSGAVAGSPQHPMVTRVAKEYGLSSTIITGASSLEKYPMLFMAYKYGAEFEFSKVGYAAALNGLAKKFAEENNLFHLETNITISGTGKDLYDFHKIGAYQVENLPHKTKNIFIPAGSCNSVTSMLVGLAENMLPNLEKIVMFGIGAMGSNKPNFVPDRMRKIAEHTEVDYDSIFDFQTDEEPEFTKYNGLQPAVIRHDLNGTGYCRYEDWMPFEQDGINFHPRYEGKVLNYIYNHYVSFADYTDILFWNVGVEPK